MNRVMLALVVVCLAGCGGAGAPAPAGPVVTVTATPSVSPTDSMRPAPSDALEMFDDGSSAAPSPASSLVWDAAAEEAATTAATTVVQRFARPGSETTGQWWPRLRPLLSVRAQADYEWVDPASVPVSRVTGDAVAEASSRAGVARVLVPTDAGAYVVVLVRTDTSAQWLADRILPPGEGQ